MSAASAREELEAAVRWRPVPGWDGLYEVSDHGSVRSLRSGKILKPWLATGYQMIGLSQGGSRARKLVHQLVAEAFIGPCPEGQQVRHGAGGQLDNRAVNLSYGTPSANMADKVRDGTHQIGTRNGFARLTEPAVAECRRRYSAGETCTALAAEHGVNLSTIFLAVTGRTWRHVEAAT